LATADEALRLAELADDNSVQLYSHAYLANSLNMIGDIHTSLANVVAALQCQKMVNDRPIWGWPGLRCAQVLQRVGRVRAATRLSQGNMDVLCWSCLVEAQHALARAVGPERAKQISPGQRPGSSEDNAAEALKGLRTAKTTSFPSVSQGVALGWHVAGPSGLKSAHTALESGLKIARDCGFGLYHIDLLLDRARLHLLQGDAGAALDDIEVALGDEAGKGGIPANQATGQPQLLATKPAAMPGPFPPACSCVPKLCCCKPLGNLAPPLSAAGASPRFFDRWLHDGTGR